jgi:transposase
MAYREQSVVVYRRSQEIEKRLEEVLRLISVGGYATPALAKSLQVSIPTISRCVTALRERGHNIRAVKHADGWQYVITHVKKPKNRKHIHSTTDELGATRP